MINSLFYFTGAFFWAVVCLWLAGRTLYSAALAVDYVLWLKSVARRRPTKPETVRHMLHWWWRFFSDHPDARFNSVQIGANSWHGFRDWRVGRFRDSEADE